MRTTQWAVFIASCFRTVASQHDPFDDASSLRYFLERGCPFTIHQDSLDGDEVSYLAGPNDPACMKGCTLVQRHDMNQPNLIFSLEKGLYINAKSGNITLGLAMVATNRVLSVINAKKKRSSSRSYIAIMLLIRAHQRLGFFLMTRREKPIYKFAEKRLGDYISFYLPDRKRQFGYVGRRMYGRLYEDCSIRGSKVVVTLHMNGSISSVSTTR